MPRCRCDRSPRPTFAYLQIRQQILEGELAPGMSLDQEALAQSLRLSTTPVREALRRLESERLVVSRAHRDTAVAPLSLDTVEEVYAVRLSLDPLAASLAATHAGDAERESIRTLSRQHPPENDPASAVYYNRYLHRYKLIISRSVAGVTVAAQEHSPIVSAVLDGSPDRAAKLMRGHLAASLSQIRKAVAGRARVPAAPSRRRPRGASAAR
jgi:DNA-binding GntR family transcriptional regulator